MLCAENVSGLGDSRTSRVRRGRTVVGITLARDRTSELVQMLYTEFGLQRLQGFPRVFIYPSRSSNDRFKTFHRSNDCSQSFSLRYRTTSSLVTSVRDGPHQRPNDGGRARACIDELVNAAHCVNLSMSARLHAKNAAISSLH